MLFLLCIIMRKGGTGMEQQTWTGTKVSFERFSPECRRSVWIVFAAVLASTLAAHGFLFSNEFFSHDSVSYFTYATGSFSFYTGIGRFVIPVYELIKGDVAAPWLIGLLFILWMTLTALVVTHLLKIRSTFGMILTTSLLCTNTALTLTGATYIYCMDEYAFALFTAVSAVYLIHRGRWWTVPGVFLLIVSLAVYQAYFTVAASLCFLIILQKLAANEPFGKTVRSGIWYLFVLAVGFAAYYGLWSLICQISGAAKQRVEESLLGGSGLDAIINLVYEANITYVRGLFDGSGVLGWLMPAVHCMLVAALGWRLMKLLMNKHLRIGNKILLLILTCLIPTAFNSASILLAGSATQLMTFAGELIYVLLIVSYEPSEEHPVSVPLRSVATVLLCCVLWQHIVYANQVYMKKELDQTATISLATRMIDRVELLEGYIPGETPVAFVGRLDRNTYLNCGRDEFIELDKTVGLWSDYSATYNLGRYLTDYMNYPLLWDTETDFSQMEEVKAMPVFPAADSIRMIEGTVVVKLSRAFAE